MTRLQIFRRGASAANPRDPGVGPQTERTGALDKWWIDKGFPTLVDGLSACDCKQGVTNGEPDQEPFDIATGCYRCAGTCVEINQCVGCTRQFFTKSFLGDHAAVLALSSGEEPASPRH